MRLSPIAGTLVAELLVVAFVATRAVPCVIIAFIAISARIVDARLATMNILG